MESRKKGRAGWRAGRRVEQDGEQKEGQSRRESRKKGREEWRGGRRAGKNGEQKEG